MFQRLDFLKNHLAQVPITLNQARTMEMRDELLSSVDAQNMDTSGYQVSDLSDLDEFELSWKNNQLDVDVVFGPGLDSSF